MPSSISKIFARKALVRAIASASVVGSFGLTAPVYAQERTAAVRGVVTSGGQPVAGATVTATNRATGLSRSATTDGTGSYFIRQLPAGVAYSIRVTSPEGSANTERLNLAVGQQAQMNYALNAIEEVVVMGAAVEVFSR